MTLQTLRREFCNLLFQNGIESPEADSGLLLMHTLSITKTELLLSDRAITPAEYQTLTDLIRRRIDGEPVRYLIGSAPFMDMEFTLNRATLIPRPDTEVLVEAVSKRIPDTPTLLWDIGCGSGCICLSLLHRHPCLSAVALDIAPLALIAARETAERYDLCDRLTLVEHDILSGMPDLPVPDIIVSNPPYIPTRDIDRLQKEVRLFEPHRALDGGVDGLDFYRLIAKHAPLNSGGLLAFEIGYDQGESVPSVLHTFGYTDVTVKKDLSANPRVVLAIHP